MGTARDHIKSNDARALVDISRSFDMPGKLGTARFLLPLLLDIQLNRLLPALFSPPTLRALQDEKYGFGELVRRKRFERVKLLALVATVGLAGRLWSRVVWGFLGR